MSRALDLLIEKPLDRRRLMVGAASLALTAGLHPAIAQQPADGIPIPADGAPFDRSQALEIARQLAKKPYSAPNAVLPDWLNGLNQEQYSGIRNKPERATWIDQPRGFIIEPLHRGFVFQAPVSLFVIEDGNIKRIAYASNRFEFGKLTPPAAGPDIGFSGFRILKTSSSEPPREVAVFQGATFLRAIARFQRFGAVTRALTLKTAEPRGEEFPFFRAFWIEQPQQDDVLVVHALLDSESVSGLFTYTLRVGDITLIDTEATVFPRVALDNVGFGAVQATYLFGQNERRTFDDYRNAVYEVGGVQMHTGRDEWIWRPVANPKQLQISVFSDENPRGYGFVMRDRDFSSFQDHDQRFELRPTLWCEPIGEWKAGSVQLIEIPSDNEIHDNIIAFWRPREPLAAGGEFQFAYRQHWGWMPPEKPTLATVTGMRIGRGNAPKRRRFVIDFSSEKLAGLKAEDITPMFWCSTSGASNMRYMPPQDPIPARFTFDLDPGNDNLIEFRLVLMAAGAPVSETWLYRWTQ